MVEFAQKCKGGVTVYRYAFDSYHSFAVFGLSCSDTNCSRGAIVLNQALTICQTIFPQTLLPSRAAVFYAPNGPMSFKQNSIITLKTESRYPVQMFYQFAHELCHLCTPDPVPEKFEFFEESLCELASLALLSEAARHPELNPLFCDNVTANDAFSSYLGTVKREPQPSGTAAFLTEHLEALQKDRYLRPLNAALAFALLPLFQQDISAWHLLSYLNRMNASLDFPDALSLLCREIHTQVPAVSVLHQTLLGKPLVL